MTLRRSGRSRRHAHDGLVGSGGEQSGLRGGAVVLAIIGGLIVWLRHRQPKSVDANVESFHRGLRALAPDASQPGIGSGYGQHRIRRVAHPTTTTRRG